MYAESAICFERVKSTPGSCSFLVVRVVNIRTHRPGGYEFAPLFLLQLLLLIQEQQQQQQLWSSFGAALQRAEYSVGNIVATAVPVQTCWWYQRSYSSSTANTHIKKVVDDKALNGRSMGRKKQKENVADVVRIPTSTGVRTPFFN